jgi:heme/copper-type cytochrome/quinol oxidase subunit 4
MKYILSIILSLTLTIIGLWCVYIIATCKYPHWIFKFGILTILLPCAIQYKKWFMQLFSSKEKYKIHIIKYRFSKRANQQQIKRLSEL